MSRSICKFLALCLLLSAAIQLSAADKKKEAAAKIPLYQGIQVGVDLLSPTKALFSDSHGASVKADINLKNKYFPTLELGYNTIDETNETGIRFTSTGRYLKLGINKALTYRGLQAENVFYAGAHYGFTAFSYNLDNLTYNQDYWGNPGLHQIQNEQSTAGWIELVTGVRVQVYGPFSLGWTFQYKSTLHVSNGENSIPAYIPGYGANLKPNAGVAVHLYYKLPF